MHKLLLSLVGLDPVAELLRFAEQLLEVITFGDFGVSSTTSSELAGVDGD